jgi:hypothetical protein
MPAIYAAVARGTAVLAEYAVLAGNFSAVARDYLAKTGSGGGGGGGAAGLAWSAAASSAAAASAGTRSSYTVDGHLFSFLADADGFSKS